jgi:hypothetical protein
MLDACPSFDGDGVDSEYTAAGTARHLGVRAVLEGEAVLNSPSVKMSELIRHLSASQKVVDSLSPDDRESVEWAVDYIKVHAPTSQYPLQFERHVNPLDENFERLFPDGGTLDIECGPELFDLKSRERDYRSQLAAYALAMMQEHGYESVRCHVLYMIPKRYEVFSLTRAEAEKIVGDIIAKQGTQATPCDYCGWCVKKLVCPARLEQVNAVVAGRPDWQLEQYHSSEIKTADEAGRARRLADHVKKWADGILFHTTELARKEGIVATGYKIADSKGKAVVTDAPRAFQLAGVPQDVFFKCCAVRLNSSKDYPDRVGLVESYASQNGIPKSRAKKQITEKLAEVITRGEPGIKLVALKGETEEEE